MGTEDINPWVHIWTEPRKTMRSILSTNPTRYIVLLAILSGILGMVTVVFMNKAISRPITHPFILWGIIVIVGALLGVFFLYFSGWLLTLTGSWLAGKGDFTQVKSAVGWGNYPNIIAHLIGLPQVFAANHLWVQVIFGLLSFIAGIWSFVISLKLLGEAHQFSAWKSLLAIIIAAVLILAAVIIVALLIPLLKPLFQ